MRLDAAPHAQGMGVGLVSVIDARGLRSGTLVAPLDETPCRHKHSEIPASTWSSGGHLR